MKEPQSVDDATPIIVGVGQITETVPEDLSTASSHADLAAKAALEAIKDTGVKGLVSHIDVIAGVKTFSDSSPMHQVKTGKTNNFPRSIAKRIGADPDYAIYDSVGGDSPQKLVAEMAKKLAAGQHTIALLAGGEALANVKASKKQKIELDWSEEIVGQLEDRGRLGKHIITAEETKHRVLMPMQFYALMENALRANLKQDQKSYNQEIGKDLAALSKIAAQNPYAVDRQQYDGAAITDTTDRNPIIVAPYTKKMIAKDRVNQGAAVLMTTVGKAKELGIDEAKWVYLHSSSYVSEEVLLKRSSIGQSLAMERAIKGAISSCGLNSSEIKHLDMYSCFPIVIREAKRILQLEKSDTRPLTVTGGLPFFGGPGNNYTMHAIATMVEKLRTDKGGFGLIYANGGWMSKHAVGIYSATAPTSAWKPSSSEHLQKEVDDQQHLEISRRPNGEATLESYTIHYFKGFPMKAIVIGRLKNTNQRFYASTTLPDTETVKYIANNDPLGASIFVEYDPRGNRFAFKENDLRKYRPKLIDTFKEKYKFCKVEREGWILKVTIDRPAVRNALHPPANEELAGVFNAFEKDTNLRVAILTGEGKESFSAGNDIKHMAAGNPMYIPEMGFAGLTSRRNRIKPVIAAINGHALGGGLEIAMACDLIIASEAAKLGLPEVKIGLFAGAGGVQRLSRQIGKKAAMEMMLTGQAITAQKALDLGLINYIAAPDELMSKALELANKITLASPSAVQSTMKLYHHTAGHASEDEAVTTPHDIFDDLLNSNDFWEGSRAFAEKRKPKWTIKNY